MAYSPKADDFNILVNDVPELTEAEKITLLSAMKKARELDEQERNKMSRPLEGQLYKYTNVVKGWQYRWFILNPETGNLEYYMLDEVKKKRPRGCIYLAGAVVSPSDEDDQSFAISAACGEIYKLKATDPKERQFWVNRIRSVVEHQAKTIAEQNPPLPPREHRTGLSSIEIRSAHGQSSESHSIWHTNFHSSTSIMDVHPTNRKRSSRKHKSPSSSQNSTISTTVNEALINVRDMLLQAEDCNSSLSRTIESLSHTGNGPKCCDTNLLLLKATSAATLLTLQQCYTILQNQQVTINFPKMYGYNKDKDSLSRNLSEKSTTTHDRYKAPIAEPDPSGEVSDHEELINEEIPIEDEKHSVIMNLMSQLKLGADLTSISFPSFVLEPRSLLEMFADCLSHPDFLIKITDCPTPESRMLAVLEWYLTSFHAGREAHIAKKPYNPIVGETFRCSWKVSKCSNEENDHYSEKIYKVTYVAEQVSHHPPISAFYVECPKKNIAMSAHICVKSNFLTSYVAANFAGEVKLQLLTYGETYIFTLPSAYVRCILTVPWIELGGRISVSCPATGYNASVTFQTKPQQSGTPHKISGEIKHNEDVIYRVSGEWNGLLQFSSNDKAEVRSINVEELQRFRKHIRPLDQQDTFESRKLWQHVTKALQEENYDQANLEKQKLENQQREEEKKRIAAGTEYSGKLFQKVDDIWNYKYPLPTSENLL